MGQPQSLLGRARALARDFPRDQMPDGYLWDVADFVPTLIDANLTGRGAWRWGSGSVASGDFETGILAGFPGGDQVLVQSTDGKRWSVGLNPPYTLTDLGTTFRAKQNQIQFVNDVIHFDMSGVSVPELWREGSYVASGAFPHKPSVGVHFKSMVVTGGGPAEPNVVRFSVPGKDLTSADGYDANSAYGTGHPITGLAALRSVVLVFHAGSVERLRGSEPARGEKEGDINLEPLFDRAGCSEPKSIAYWNENVLFADEHGVHLTDGAVVRNLVSQGGILHLWRAAYEFKVSLAAQTFLDYYQITMRRSNGPPLTLICDLNRRQWFRFTNIDALTYIASGGSAGMERVWAGLAGTGRLGRIGPCFFPLLDNTPIVDDNGVSVLPMFETPWYRMGDEGRKRMRFIYLSYDARVPPASARDDKISGWRDQYIEFEPPALGAPKAVQQVLDVGYVTSPQKLEYTTAGMLPSTTEYSRYRIPVGKQPYGIAFRVAQTVPTTALRVFDLGVEAQATERSRV